MIRVVWKFPLTHYGDGEAQIVDLTVGARVAMVGIDPASGGTGVAVWVELDPSFPPERHLFKLIGTGRKLLPDFHHVGSAIDGNGEVWHAYTSPRFHPLDNNRE